MDLFGEVVDGEMRLNAAGAMVAETWRALAQRFPRVAPDTFIVMPNHFHGILFLGGGDPDSDGDSASVGAPLVGARIPDAPTTPGSKSDADRAPTRGAPTAARIPDVPTSKRIAVGDVVGAFKSLTTLEYTRGVKALGWARFRGSLWQRNYFEHIIRDEEPLAAIRGYILDNPRRWTSDRENHDTSREEPKAPAWVAGVSG
ncbi:transposase [Paludisphaera rhizosphaerae]|uniref:transposase n=1 Tax=Paludisphaera rhizosphaerae TaxID=2711216 RepID=UPI00197E3EFF